jgi:hypothetical protein
MLAPENSDSSAESPGCRGVKLQFLCQFSKMVVKYSPFPICANPIVARGYLLGKFS